MLDFLAPLLTAGLLLMSVGAGVRMFAWTAR